MPIPSDHYWTIQGAAERLNIGDSKVRRLIAAGDLVAVRFGHRTVRISQVALLNYERRAAKALPKSLAKAKRKAKP